MTNTTILTSKLADIRQNKFQIMQMPTQQSINLKCCPVTSPILKYIFYGTRYFILSFKNDVMLFSIVLFFHPCHFVSGKPSQFKTCLEASFPFQKIVFKSILLFTIIVCISVQINSNTSFLHVLGNRCSVFTCYLRRAIKRHLLTSSFTLTDQCLISRFGITMTSNLCTKRTRLF